LPGGRQLPVHVGMNQMGMDDVLAKDSNFAAQARHETWVEVNTSRNCRVGDPAGFNC
jgi:hypothetical protein